MSSNASSNVEVMVKPFVSMSAADGRLHTGGAHRPGRYAPDTSVTDPHPTRPPSVPSMSARMFLGRSGIRPVCPGGGPVLALVSRATPPNSGTVHSPFTFTPAEPPTGPRQRSGIRPWRPPSGLACLVHRSRRVGESSGRAGCVESLPTSSPTPNVSSSTGRPSVVSVLVTRPR